jgi:effector-binding domain-containing protein
MGQTSAPVIIDSTPMTVAVVRQRVPMAEIVDFYDRVYGTVAGVIEAQDAAIAAPPVGIYFGQPSDTVDVAAGFPITGSIAASDGVESMEMPSRRIAQLLYTGAYDGLPGAYSTLADYIVAEGLRPGDVMWEQYLTDPTPEADPNAMQTLICWAIDA